MTQEQRDAELNAEQSRPVKRPLPTFKQGQRVYGKFKGRFATVLLATDVGIWQRLWLRGDDGVTFPAWADDCRSEKAELEDRQAHKEQAVT